MKDVLTILYDLQAELAGLTRMLEDGEVDEAYWLVESMYKDCMAELKAHGEDLDVPDNTPFVLNPLRGLPF